MFILLHFAMKKMMLSYLLLMLLMPLLLLMMLMLTSVYFVALLFVYFCFSFPVFLQSRSFFPHQRRPPDESFFP
jgi:hypothetical protein